MAIGAFDAALVVWDLPVALIAARKWLSNCAPVNRQLARSDSDLNEVNWFASGDGVNADNAHEYSNAL